jgi:hypothetical protein
MNINFSAHAFSNSPLVWGVLTAIVLIALATLGMARLRQWI